MIYLFLTFFNLIFRLFIFLRIFFPTEKKIMYNRWNRSKWINNLWLLFQWYTHEIASDSGNTLFRSFHTTLNLIFLKSLACCTLLRFSAGCWYLHYVRKEISSERLVIGFLSSLYVFWYAWHYFEENRKMLNKGSILDIKINETEIRGFFLYFLFFIIIDGARVT